MSGLPAPVSARISRTGWASLFTCFAVGAAALNTGNNLLYLVLGLVLAAHPISLWWSRASLRAVSAEFLPPSEPRAGQPFDIALRLVASKARAATGIVFELSGRDEQRAPGTKPQWWRRPLFRSRRVEQRDAFAGETGAAPRPFALALLRRGEHRALSLAATIPRRGDVTLELVARSPFPFGLVDSMRPMASARILVLPAPDPAWHEEVAPAREDGRSLNERGMGADILNIRDHHAGDDARRIDWKATARMDRTMVREFAREESRRALIVVDAIRVPAGIDREAGAERAISRAAAAIEALSGEGWRVALLLPDGRRNGSPLELLRELARLRVRPESSGSWWAGQVLDGEAPIVFRSGAP